MPDGAELLALLRAAMPKGITIAADDPRAGPFGMWPGESLDKAVPKRLAEFAAGRRAARAAMAMHGMEAAPIAHGQDRAPQWPMGVTGSISHAKDLCLAMIGRLRDWHGLGLDLEQDQGLDSALWPDVLRVEELAAIYQFSAGKQGQVATMVFVAKEAVYKAIYPTSQTMLDFHDLRITLDQTTFRARLMRAVPGFAQGSEVDGTLCRADGYIAAFCALRRAAGA
jgi:4'-phosphopantetheinyl transferase EntD